MPQSTSPSTVCILGIALGLLVPPTVAGAQEGRSAAQVKELTALMTARQLETVAAQDPEAADHFVAALLVPGVQLLLVSARYPSPPELQAQLAQQKYRDVYTALHQPSAQSTRFFLMDAGCDGLHGSADGVDVLYEKGTTQTLFDGQWKQQGLSEATYNKRAQEAEASYSRLLALLTASLKASPGAIAP
jgi:hypothetical protein